MSAMPQTLLNEMGETFGSSNVSRAGPEDAVDGVAPQIVVEQESAEKTAAFLGIAVTRGLRVAPRGGGTKMDWGSTPRVIDVVLSTKKLCRVVEHAWADMTATVEAGCTISEFQEALGKHGQHLALDPLWPDHATVGGVLATNDSGALRIRFGALRDLIIGVTIALPGGTLAKSGGKVVKNVAGYDLQKLLTGSFGTLGVITEATFRLYPLSRESRTLSFTASGVDVLNQLALAIHDSKLAPTGVQILAGSDRRPRLDVRLEGIKAAIEAQTEHLGLLTRRLTGVEEVDPAADAWRARERLWQGVNNNVEFDSVANVAKLAGVATAARAARAVCKVTLFPADVGRFCSIVAGVTVPLQIAWNVVAQSIGIGTLRLDAPELQSCVEALLSLRRELVLSGGSLVILRCSAEVRAEIDVWGTPGDALPLMRRVKDLFDPNGVLNPGRFVGGI